MSCGKTCTPIKRVQKDRYFSLFKAWVTTSITIKALGEKGHVSSRSLRRHFETFLLRSPQPEAASSLNQIYLKVDGTYFKRWGCALAFKARGKIVFWDFVERENYFRYCLDFSKLATLGYVVRGVTSDWHGSLVASVKDKFPDVPHQRCLVHTKRLCQTLLTQHPETKAGQELLELARVLPAVKTHAESNIWLTWLTRFENRHQEALNHRTYHSDHKHWWFTHRNVRRAFRTLKTSTNNLFLYLDVPELTSNTNCLEAEFTHLKQKLKVHNGLKRSKKINFINYYFYFKSF